jgi:heterodisulfide reductase subunit A2
MTTIGNTGIIFCDFAENGSDEINVSEVFNYAKDSLKIPVILSNNNGLFSNSKHLTAAIMENSLNRIIIAGKKPGFYKSFVAKAMVDAGNDAKNVHLASFNEHNALFNSQTDLAKAKVACSYYDVPFENAAILPENDVHPDTLVIGGGIAGIQASLEIADAKQKVFLVEKTGTIGGHMAQFDKTFPTLDCAACILTPKMVEIGQHPFIDLLTYSEIKEVSGTPGNFKVKILKKARRINLATCIGCGTCAEKCPSKVSSEFDHGTTLRRAAYIPFPQAVPNKYLIDEENCTYVENGKCGVCVKVCPVPDCINLDEKDEEIEITVGNIIVATGFQPFDAKKIEQYGYGRYPNVLTSLEFERLINAAGPTGGYIVSRTQDKKGNWIFEKGSPEPASVAIVHCVGSRDENHNKYCSKVCCMYSLKLAHLVKEKLPDAKVYEYYIDMRAFGKGYEEFYNRIATEGINIVRGRTANIEQHNDQLKLRTEDIENLQLLEQDVDMVILAVGLEPHSKAKEFANMLGISSDMNGWYNEAHSISNPVDTYTGGISIAGLCQSPKDIPDTVAQASAAASRVLKSILHGKVKASLNDLTLSDIETKAKELTI